MMATTAGRARPPILFAALLGLVVLAPLPLGAVEGWGWGLLATAVGALLAVWSARVLTGAEQPAFGLRPLWPLLLLFGLVVLWIWLQTTSLAPASWRHPLWRSAADALGRDLPGSISLDPYEGLSALARLLCYAAVFWLALQYGRRADRVRTALLWLTYAGMAYALYGLIVHFFDLRAILIFRKTAYLEDLTSTFVNRNSYATYVGLGLVCATAMLLLAVARVSRVALGDERRVIRVAAAVAEQAWPLILAWFSMLLAILLTHSRAGFASAMLALGALLLATAASAAANRRLIALFAAGGGVLLLLFVMLSGGKLIERFTEMSESDRERPQVYELTLDAIGDSGAFGSGYGTFEQVFRFYRTPEIKRVFDKAHSVYLENALELGPPAAMAMALIPALLAAACVRGLIVRRRDAIYPAIGVAATILVGGHSLVDFSMQIPAVAITYAFLMGLACAQSASSRRADDPW